MAIRTESIPKTKEAKVAHTQLVFDVNGNIVLSETLDCPIGRHRQHRQMEIIEEDLKYLLCLGDQLFTWRRLPRYLCIYVSTYALYIHVHVT